MKGEYIYRKKHFLFIPYLLFTLCSISITQDEIQKKLEYEVTVTLKLVQVYVLDRQGNAVTDLTKDDFLLYDDGEIKNITEFEKHELSLNPAFPIQPPPVATVAPVEKITRKIFFFFDFSYNSFGGIAKSRRAALDFLDTQVRSDDLVGVLSFSARKGLVLHEYLTADYRKVREVIEGFGTGQFLGRAWMMQSEGLKEQLNVEQALQGDGTSRMFKAEQANARRQSFGFISQLSELAKALKAIPGIKNIILFSSGIPNYMLFGGTTMLDEYGNRWGDANLRDLFDEMCKELTGSNCAVYTVNVTRAGAVSYEERDLNGDEALRHLARESGGKYFDNINVYNDINKTIQKVTGAYYVLGYYIDEKKDGRFHSVRIKVKRKGCEVFGQKGYFNPKPFSEYSENERLMHIIDLALSDDPLFQSPAELSVTALPIVEQGKPAVLALAHLPRKLALKALESRAEALCLLFNEKGDAEAIIPLKISNPDPSKDFYQIVFNVLAKPGKTVVRIAICNMKTGDGIRGVQACTVPEADASSLRLDPPLVLTDARVAEIQAASGTSIDALYGYDPKEYSVLSGAIPAGMTKLRAALRITSDKPEVEINLTGRLGFADGGISADIPVSILRESIVGPTRKMIIDLDVGELKPGRYTLTLLAREKDGPSVAYTTVILNVE